MSMQDQALARWNWGAFVFTWIWAFAMRMWIVALPLLLVNLACYFVNMMNFWAGAVIETSETIPNVEHAGHSHAGNGEPASSAALVVSTVVIRVVLVAVVVNVLAGIVLGFIGNRMAWKSRKWESLLQFRMTQLAWEKYGRPVGITILTLVPMYFILSKFAS